MCGRFSFNPDDKFYQRFGVSNKLNFLPKNDNITPSQLTPVIIRQNANLVWVMRWGLVPFWSKDEKIGNRMFNARAESVVEKPAFRKAYKSQRCLVPANGFYEWKTEKNKKIPYYFEVKNRPLISFAGLFDVWEEPVSGNQTYTFTIITTTPNSVVKPIHDRMPVILIEKDEPAWLDPSTSNTVLQSILQPSPELLSVKIRQIT